MGGTTPKGYPYPTGADRVADGDNAIQSLATFIDSKMFIHRGHGNNLDAVVAQPSHPTSLIIITGHVAVNFGAQGVGAAVVFPGGGFPNGVLSISFTSNAAYVFGINGLNGISKTQFVPYAPGAANAVNVEVIYTAIGY